MHSKRRKEVVARAQEKQQKIESEKQLDMTPPRKRAQLQVGSTGLRMIRDCSQRCEWQSKVQPSNTVWAFYNDWGNLYFEPYHRPATTYYDTPWLYVPVQHFAMPGFVLLSPYRSAIGVQNCGPDMSGYVTLIFGSCAHQHYIIPPGHILYVEMKDGITVVSSHLQIQPLPWQLLPRVR